MSPVALAKRDPDVNRALKKEYPDCTTEVVNVRNVNGVKVSDVKVTTKHGECMAKVTEYGDFVLVGEPRGNSNISKPAIDTLNGLFKRGQQDVDVYRVTSYLVDVKSDKKWFRLRYDPVGELHDISNEAEMKKDDIKNLEKVDRKDHADKADDYARKYIEGAKVEGVYRNPEDDDFFIVDMKQKDGKDARITISNVGRVLSERDEIDVNDIPKPVLDGMDQMFDRTKIARAYRYEYEYYQFDKVSNSGDRVSVNIRPNGDVLSVHNEGSARVEADVKKRK
jgi:hypothetical protein